MPEAYRSFAIDEQRTGTLWLTPLPRGAVKRRTGGPFVRPPQFRALSRSAREACRLPLETHLWLFKLFKTRSCSACPGRTADSIVQAAFPSAMSRTSGPKADRTVPAPRAKDFSNPISAAVRSFSAGSPFRWRRALLRSLCFRLCRPRGRALDPSIRR